MIYKSERSNAASNDPRLPVVDVVEEIATNRLDVLLKDEDDDDDDEAADTTDEDYNATASSRKPQTMGRTRKTPPAKVSRFILEPRKCLLTLFYSLAKNSCRMQRMPRTV